jgi:uncharacterized cupredoxin-like copper-binding protein
MKFRQHLVQAIRRRLNGGAWSSGTHIPRLTKTRLSIAGAGVALIIGTFCTRAPAADTAPNVDWSKAEVVNVITTEYTFTPSRLRFRRGVAYRLHLENPGSEMHELTSLDFFKAIEMKNPEVLVAAGNEVVLQPKEQKDVYFIPRKPGRYELTCADHDWAGMTGEIVIE